MRCESMLKFGLLELETKKFSTELKTKGGKMFPQQ